MARTVASGYLKIVDILHLVDVGVKTINNFAPISIAP